MAKLELLSSGNEKRSKCKCHKPFFFFFFFFVEHVTSDLLACTKPKGGYAVRGGNTKPRLYKASYR